MDPYQKNLKLFFHPDGIKFLHQSKANVQVFSNFSFYFFGFFSTSIHVQVAILYAEKEKSKVVEECLDYCYVFKASIEELFDEVVSLL